MGTAQYETIRDIKAIGDRVDFVAHYAPSENIALGMNVEARWKLGEYGSGDFAKEIGAVNVLSPGFSDTGAFLRELWGEYKEDTFVVRAGIINSNSFIDRSYYNSYAKFFMSHATASHSYGQVPLSSLGVGLSYKKQHYYLSGVLSDATLKIDAAVDDIVKGNLNLYSGLEAGYTPNNDVYFINIWRKVNKNGLLSYGSYLSSNTEIDTHNKLFVKLGTSRNTKIKNRFSFGWSYDGLFSKDGLLLAAFEASQVAQTEKFQKSYEILYRYKLAYAAEVSADLQVVQDTIDRDEDLAIVPGVRLRIIF